ncbi:MAG TPA: O-antigen ligase family protein [Ilumatobacter sp.]
MPEEAYRGTAAILPHLAGAVLLGSAVALDPGGWYPFGPAKWFVVSTLIAAAATCALACGLPPRLPCWAGALFAALLGWLTLAAVFGRDPLYAWTGTPERHLGVLAWVLFGACFVIGSMLDSSGVRVVARWCVVATLWCGGYAIVEWWFGQPVETSAVTSRLGGPFGSAAYLGAALCLLIPIAVGVAADESELTGWRAAGAAAAVLAAIALLGTGSRAAWIGLFVAAFVAAVMIRPRWRFVLVAIGAVAACVVVMLPRLDDVLDRSVSTTSRLDEWAMAARVVADHPVVGVGPEGYRTALADGVTADYERSYGREALPDRAHSAPLDLAAVGGLPAALLYVALVGGVAVVAVRRMRSGVLIAGLAAAAVAYLVQQLLLFPIAELDPILWLAAGMLLATPAPATAPGPVRRTRVRAAVAGLLTAALFVSGVLGVAADRAAGDLTLSGARRATELRPDVVRYHLLVSALAAREGTLSGIDASIAAADEALDVSPNDPVARLAAARARTDRALATGDTIDVTRAFATWESLVDDDPLCYECLLGSGSAAALAGDAEQAEQAWRAAASLAREGDDRAADALARLAASRSANP